MTNPTIISALMFLSISLTVNTQENKDAEQTTHAVRSYASGADSYLKFSGDTYKPGKKYVALKLWNKKAPLTETEKAELSNLKKHLSKKDIQIVDYEWKNENELKKR